MIRKGVEQGHYTTGCVCTVEWYSNIYEQVMAEASHWIAYAREDIEKSVDFLQITKSFSYNYCIIAQKETREKETVHSSLSKQVNRNSMGSGIMVAEEKRG